MKEEKMTLEKFLERAVNEHEPSQNSPALLWRSTRMLAAIRHWMTRPTPYYQRAQRKPETR